ncbi:MAG: hypothetical protein ISS70_01950 [Phycisphaerae bacterium]|nr:hypothetical protein [Phycisphaerae bacterium]
MNYDFPLSSDLIEQGDIFMNIPCVAFDFSGELSVLEEGAKPVNLTWEEIVNDKKDVAAILGIDSVPAIVATQTCDAQSKEYVTLCQILELSEIKPFREYKQRTTKRLAEELITQHRKMPGFFYLPPDSKVGFSDRMAVAFANTIRVRRKSLEKFVANRKGRLNKMAYEHFREKLSHFFHRYAWNEWYILNKEEIEAHKEYCTYPPNKLFDHQK